MHDENATTLLRERRARVTSPAEGAVVDYLLDAGPQAATMSARQIAAAVGTSDATVVRAARSLGFESLREVRDLLVAPPVEQADLRSRLRATVAASDSSLSAAIERQLRALEDLAARVDGPRFEAAATLLTGASRTWWCGVGPSAQLARYAAFLSRRLGRQGGAFTSSGTDHADELLELAAGDVAVVLAYGRLHPYVSVLLRRAAAVGAKVVLITDTGGGDEPVDVRLEAGRGTPGLFATHGPTVVLLEALVLAVASADASRADTSIDQLNELRRELAGRRVDVDPR